MVMTKDALDFWQWPNIALTFDNDQILPWPIAMTNDHLDLWKQLKFSLVNENNKIFI